MADQDRFAPSWRMWVAPTSIMLCTLLSYIDRQVLAVLSPTILKETGLKASDYTNAVAAFSVLYTIGNPLWGSFLDYIGLRRGMLLSVAMWTTASTAHAWVGGFWGFAVARAFLGFGEGAVFPGAFRTSMEALPANKQSRGVALGYSGASMGALITPIIVIPFAGVFGWRTAFLVTGALGALWMILWNALARPPYLPAESGSTVKIAWPKLNDRRVWVIASSFGLGGMALGVAAYLSPLYLTRAMGLTQAQLAPIAWIPMLGWEIGYFFWGWVADRYAANDDRPARIFLLLTVLSIPTAFMTLATHWAVVIALFFWSTFIADGFVVMSLRVGSRIFPKNQAGMVAGLGSASWGLIQAIILPVYGQLFDREMYLATFVSMSALPLLGTLLWLWLTRPWSGASGLGASIARTSDLRA